MKTQQLQNVAIAGLTSLFVGQASATSRVASSSPIASPSSFPPHISVECHTRLATTSVAVVPTSTVTRTIQDYNPVVVYVTTQETITTTPSVVTEVETSFETQTVTSTASAITDTFSTTSTVYAYTVVTVTPPPGTSTVLVTTTTTQTTTSTIPAPAGFTPLVDSLLQPTFFRRGLDDDNTCPIGPDDYKYPSAVKCIAKLTVTPTTTSTVTAVPLTNTASTPVVTTTLTSTLTSTSVVIPEEVSVTLSYSTTLQQTLTTSGIPTYTVVTATTTQTASVSATPVYNACLSNNIGGGSPLGPEYGPIAGKVVDALYFTSLPGAHLNTVATSSAYDCCVQCQGTPNCAGSFYIRNDCYLVTTTVCSTSSHIHAHANNGAGGFDISNGPCATYVLGTS
ncbi:Uncharacterized protein PECH_001991 [Penicillium ucsense]|uniref:Apple domain-containing protein n=1 Tax=Penicillium ucsense TaxID=2839758 RepID=A0A8J8VWM5_9EURO|nr:Uncharacterized protein PECM_001999 [Penicillium ucsense]KAF7731347.1 Uncharacterized protein PECH_001991 [Penicillium ucsense]